MRLFTIPLLLIISVSGWAHEDGEHEKAIPPLFDLMSFTTFDRVQYTLVEYIQMSDVIVQGHIESITQGRILRRPDGRKGGFSMALIKFKVSETLKGNPGEYVYFEWLKGGMPAEKMRKNRYTQQMIIMLGPPDFGSDYYRIDNSKYALRSEVDKVYSLVTERALFIHDEDRVYAPLGQDSDPLIEGDDLGDISVQINSLLNFGPPPEKYQHFLDQQ